MASYRLLQTVRDRNDCIACVKTMWRAQASVYRRCFLILTVFSLTACASHYGDATVSDPYGFFSGMLHGFLFPLVLVAKIFAWIISLVGFHFLEGVTFVGRPNTGFLMYYIGYFLGLMFWASAA